MRTEYRLSLSVLVALTLTFNAAPAQADGWNPNISDVMNLIYCVVGISPCDGLEPGGEPVDITSDNAAVYEEAYAAGAASVDTDALYQEAYGAGAASVDTEGIYDEGFAAGEASVVCECTSDPVPCMADPLCGDAFAGLDSDMDGIVDPTEWNASGETEDLFAILDTNADGSVDPDEAATAFSAANYEGASIGEYAAVGMNTEFVAANAQGGYWWCVGTILLAEAYTAGCLAAAPAAAAACAGVCAGTLGLGCVACVVAAGAGGIALCEAAFNKWTAASNAGCLGVAVAGLPDGGGTMFCIADTECGPGMVCSAGGCVYAPVCDDDPICGETFLTLDTDGDNAIDSSEWGAYGEEPDLFAYLDGNGDGTVDPEESAQIFSSAFYDGVPEEDYADAGLDTQLANANAQGGYWWCVGTILLAEAYSAGCIAAAPAAVIGCGAVCAGTIGLGCIACVIGAGAGGIALCEAAHSKWTAASDGGCLGVATAGTPGGGTMVCSLDDDCGEGMVCSAGGCIFDSGTGTGGEPTCWADSDCTVGMVCSAGACVANTDTGTGGGDTCSIDSDCPQGLACMAGVCTSDAGGTGGGPGGMP